MRQCAGREVRQPGREGASPAGFKLLSVNVTRCYLDSNYTCQLSLSPHLSLSPRLSVCLSASLNPRTLYFSVLNKTMRSFFFFLYSSVTSLRVSQYYRRLDSLPHSHSVFTAALILFLLDYLTHRGCRSLNSQQISNTARGKQKKSDIDTGVVRRLPGRGESSRCLRSFILRHEEGRPDAQTQGYVCWMNGWIRLLILSLNLIGIALTREEQTVIYFKSTEAGLPAGQSWQL